MVLISTDSSSTGMDQIHTAPARYTAMAAEWAVRRTAASTGSSSSAKVSDNSTEQDRSLITVRADVSGDSTISLTNSAVSPVQAALSSAAQAGARLGVPGADSAERAVKKRFKESRGRTLAGCLAAGLSSYIIRYTIRCLMRTAGAPNRFGYESRAGSPYRSTAYSSTVSVQD